MVTHQIWFLENFFIWPVFIQVNIWRTKWKKGGLGVKNGDQIYQKEQESTITCSSFWLNNETKLKCFHVTPQCKVLWWTCRVAEATLSAFTDVQYYGDVPWWPCGPAGASLHPRKQDPLPDFAGHVKECSYVEKHEEQEPGFWRREGQGSYSQGTRWEGRLWTRTPLHCTVSWLLVSGLGSRTLIPFRPLSLWIGSSFDTEPHFLAYSGCLQHPLTHASRILF